MEFYSKDIQILRQSQMKMAHKFLKDNHHQFPEVKLTTNMDELNATMPPSWFKKMVDYADVEMNRTMGSSSDFTMASELMRNS